MPTPEHRLERSLRAIFLGMIVNAGLTVCKFAAGIFGHSHALIADAVESTADVISSIIVWRGLVVADEPADREHPYGHGKAEPLAAAFVSVMLLGAALIIIIKSAKDLTEPRDQPRAFTLIVLLAVVVVKELLFRFVSREASAAQSMAMRADAWHHRSDAITSLAAFIGISVSLIGGRKFACADDVAAILAGGIVGWNGLQMLRPALNELMDASPSSTVIQQIRSAAAQVSGVNAVEKCIVRKAGADHFVDMHIEVDPALTVRQAHLIAHHVKDKVKESVPEVSDVLVHIEPSP
jgi:cation diffusion facilitator family transporter